MDHPVTLDVRPWRTTALVASALAAVELVVLVIAGMALLGGPISRQVHESAAARTLPRVERTPVAKRTPEAASLAREETSVLVLNGNGRSGAASEAAAQVQSRGYLVGGTGNAPSADHPRTLVMYRPGYEGEGRRLAKDLGITLVGPLDGMAPKELLGAHLALVLGAA